MSDRFLHFCARAPVFYQTSTRGGVDGRWPMTPMTMRSSSVDRFTSHNNNITNINSLFWSPSSLFIHTESALRYCAFSVCIAACFLRCFCLSVSSLLRVPQTLVPPLLSLPSTRLHFKNQRKSLNKQNLPSPTFFLKGKSKLK